MLAHLISFENLSKGSTGMIKTYKEIRKELEKYDKKLGLASDGLEEKKEIIVLTKSDVVEDSKIIEREVVKFEKLGKKVFVVSLFDDKMVKKFRDELTKILKSSS
jgi:GTPase involved in cell partitioning and DNA repair